MFMPNDRYDHPTILPLRPIYHQCRAQNGLFPLTIIIIIFNIIFIIMVFIIMVFITIAIMVVIRENNDNNDNLELNIFI